jgi:predicted RNase H-like nuclease
MALVKHDGTCCVVQRLPHAVRHQDGGAGPDDLPDALACATIARRIHAGTARPFPDPRERDAFGLPVAIGA